MKATHFAHVENAEDSGGTLSPLPPVLSRGLPVVTVVGFLSFTSTLSLLIYLTFKLVKWQIRPPTEKRPTSPEPQSPTTTDYNGFLVPEAHLCPQGEKKWDPVQETFWERLRRDPPNQFLVLIYNLLLADIQQSLAFLLNATWLSRNAVQAGTSACWAQGWLVSVGDLASSVFIFAIGVHTYLGVNRGYRPPSRYFYAMIGSLWTFVYGTAFLGVIITNVGSSDGGALYVRAGAWCWINSDYQSLRLSLHYLWIFISLGSTTAIYLLIFYNLHRQQATLKAGNASSQHYPNPDPNGSANWEPPSSPTSSIMSSMTKRLPPLPPSQGRHPTFLLYPLIYVICTAPLAAGRIAAMAGRDVGLGYLCVAGAMIAANGLLDTLLYGLTRRGIVFAADVPGQDTGLETFAFMRTPPGRRFGNMVYVSGGDGGNGEHGTRRRWAGWNSKAIASARLRTLNGSFSGGGSVTSLGRKNSSKETLGGSMKGFGMGAGEVMGMAIQCETVTKVVIEKSTETRKSSSTASSRSSTKST